MTPFRAAGRVDGIPLTFALFLGAGAVAMVAVAGIADAKGWVFGVLFGAPAIWFAWLCIPSSLALDDDGLTFRHKLIGRRFPWSEIAALGTGPGTLLVRLTPTAARARRLRKPESLYHLEIRGREKQLLEEALTRWKAAGGDGTVFDFLTTFMAASRDLRQVAEKLIEIQAEVECKLEIERVKDGALIFVVVARARAPRPLEQAIKRAVEEALHEHRYNPEFAGEIRLSLSLTEAIPAALAKAALSGLSASLTADFAERGITASAGRPLKFLHQREA